MGWSAPSPPGEDRCAAALARAPVVVFHQDLELRYTWVPSPMPELGVDEPGAAIGRSDAELLAPPSAAALTQLKRRVIERDAGERAEVEVRCGDATFVLDLTVEPLHDPGGVVAGIACAAIDVTDRRRAEDDLRHSQELLTTAEHLARLGTWEWDLVTDRVRWSDGLYDVYGLAVERSGERWGPREERPQRVHPDDRERVEAAVAQALDTGRELDIHYRVVRPDGRVRRIHGRAEVIVGEHGRPVRMAGTVQDVTDLPAAVPFGRRASDVQRGPRPEPPGGTDVEALLTPRQLEILGLIADGRSNHDIATGLYLSEATVKWHVRQILRKLGVANRAEAAALYARARPAA